MVVKVALWTADCDQPWTVQNETSTRWRIIRNYLSRATFRLLCKTRFGGAIIIQNMENSLIAIKILQTMLVYAIICTTLYIRTFWNWHIIWSVINQNIWQLIIINLPALDKINENTNNYIYIYIYANISHIFTVTIVSQNSAKLCL